MNGLSADKLRVLLHLYKEENEVNGSKGDDDFEDFGISGALKSKDRDDDNILSTSPAALTSMNFFRDNVVLASLQDSTRGEWREAHVMYTFPDSHKVHYTLRCANYAEKSPHVQYRLLSVHPKINPLQLSWKIFYLWKEWFLL